MANSNKALKPTTIQLLAYYTRYDFSMWEMCMQIIYAINLHITRTKANMLFYRTDHRVQ